MYTQFAMLTQCLFSPVTVKLENVLLTVETNDLKSEVSHRNDDSKSQQ